MTNPSDRKAPAPMFNRSLMIIGVPLIGAVIALSVAGQRSAPGGITSAATATRATAAAPSATARTWSDDLSELRPLSDAFGNELRQLQYAPHATLPDITARMQAIERDVAALRIQPCLQPAVGQFKTALSMIIGITKSAYLGNGINDPALTLSVYEANQDVSKARAMMMEHRCNQG